jgi:hypothetical protein
MPSPTARSLTAPEANFGSMMDLAKTLVESGFLPRAVTKPAQAVAIILTGRELGLGPMAALRSIQMVEGKPVLAADLQLGLFKRAGGHATWKTLTATNAALVLRHPNGDEHEESFTMDDARIAGLAGKDNWKKYPKAMLRSRVITAGLKSLGFEAMAGVYDPEEMETVVVEAESVEVGGAQGESPEPPTGVDRDTGEVQEPPKPPAVTLDAEVPFGKHKGKSVREAGSGYFDYLAGQADFAEAKGRAWHTFTLAAIAAFAAEDTKQADPPPATTDEDDELFGTPEPAKAEPGPETSATETVVKALREYLKHPDVPERTFQTYTRMLDGLGENVTVSDVARIRQSVEKAVKAAS